MEKSNGSDERRRGRRRSHVDVSVDANETEKLDKGYAVWSDTRMAVGIRYTKNSRHVSFVKANSTRRKPENVKYVSGEHVIQSV